jgi:Lipopolysaccharide biosynthesis proteins, LPS:glycosyltransferases
MIQLLCSGNSAVFMGMLITALSVRKHSRAPITLHVLTMDLTDLDPVFRPIAQDQATLLEAVYREANPASRVAVHDLGDLYRKGFLGSPNARTRFTPYCFLRLFADSIPGLPDKILYLDTDVVLNGDISELYDLDIGGHEIAGVPDYYGKWFFGRSYVNSGVLLLNLKLIRETDLFQKALRLCREKRVFLPDQTALNRYAATKMLLPRKYNEQHAMHEDTLLRHFSVTFRFWPRIRTQSVKPWEIEKVHEVLGCFEFDDILLEYAGMDF